MIDREIYLGIIEQTEKQFKFAIAVRMACNQTEENYLEYFDKFTFGSHTYNHSDLYLTPEDEKIATATLEHSTTHIMSVQLDSFLQRFVEKRFEHSDQELRTAALIVRQIRNAFAHDPFNPTWEVGQPEAKNKELKIDNVLTLDTRKINGKSMQQMDYGGPLAILKLSQFVREKITNMLHKDAL